jgi:hypothetical protein
VHLLYDSTSFPEVSKKKKSQVPTMIEPPLCYSEDTNIDYAEATTRSHINDNRGEQNAIFTRYGYSSSSNDTTSSSPLPYLIRPKTCTSNNPIVLDSSRSNSPTRSNSKTSTKKLTKEASTKSQPAETSSKQVDENNNLVQIENKNLSKPTLFASPMSSSSSEKKKRKRVAENLEIESTNSATSIEFSSNSSDMPPKSKQAKVDVNKIVKRKLDGLVLASDSSSSCSLPSAKPVVKATSSSSATDHKTSKVYLNFTIYINGAFKTSTFCYF